MMLKLCLIGLIFAFIVRWLISLHKYSGFDKPPLFGDFEAQRHWMEITYNLPIDEWYRNTSRNDLLYWGLDYPPLTAYHSYICGFMQSKINSTWVELYTSRGLQDEKHKLFMRVSVILPDMLIYIPAILFYFFKCSISSPAKKKQIDTCGALLMLLYPGLILIDHGHFQYNCISLGLFVWSVNMICLDNIMWSAVLFVLAINYKQMELHHALVFFSFLLGKIMFSKDSIVQRFTRLMKLSFVVVLTFLLCWLPFLSSMDSIHQVLVRVFPFNRGLFEDKVSNFWCSLSVILKLKQIFTERQLINMSLIATLISSFPSLICVFMKPSLRQFKFSLFNVSLCFFLFSYQVHEKTILISAISSILIYIDYRREVTLFLIVSTFSMLPLFIKDDLVMPAISCTVMFHLFSNLILDYDLPSLLNLGSKDISHEGRSTDNMVLPIKSEFTLSNFLIMLSLLMMVILTLIILTLKPPAKLPDLFTIFITTFSCLQFLLFAIYFNYRQLWHFLNERTKIKAN